MYINHSIFSIWLLHFHGSRAYVAPTNIHQFFPTMLEDISSSTAIPKIVSASTQPFVPLPPKLLKFYGFALSLVGELDASLSHKPTINLIFHSRMKCITLDIHFVCDHVTKGLLNVAYISTKNQSTDALTKPLHRQHFSILRSKMMFPMEAPSYIGMMISLTSFSQYLKTKYNSIYCGCISP